MSGASDGTSVGDGGGVETPPRAAGVRIAWPSVPARLRCAVEQQLGGRVVEAVTQPGGLLTGCGRPAEDSDRDAWFCSRRSGRNSTPSSRASTGPKRVLPPRFPRGRELRACSGSSTKTAGLRWCLRTSRAPCRSCRGRRPNWEAAAEGPTLVHADLRADNDLLTGDRVVVVDWPWACLAAPWFDLVAMLPSVRAMKAAHHPVGAGEHGSLRQPGRITIRDAGPHARVSPASPPSRRHSPSACCSPRTRSRHQPRPPRRRPVGPPASPSRPAHR